MTSNVSKSQIAASEGKKMGVGSSLIRFLVGSDVEIEECGPISDREFNLLMAFVALATLTFACVVHGWLL